MVYYCRSRVGQGVTKFAPFTSGPTVRERNLAGALGRVEHSSGSGARDRFGVKVVGHIRVTVRHCGTDIAESILVQDPQ
jgi:hypothetical protein